MGGSYMKAYVRCPFYREDAYKTQITCEGIEQESVLVLRYRKSEQWKKQMEVFCCEHYKRCEVYRMLMDKYEG